MEDKHAMPAPLALFAFNRPQTLARVLASLARCDRLSAQGARQVYAFLDGPRESRGSVERERTREVRRLVERFRSECAPRMEIVAREKNLGNTVNMPDGISRILSLHGRAIVVEDDIVVSRHFLEFMDSALEHYACDTRIWCVNGWRNRRVRVPRSYRADVYLTPRPMCWGWGVWRDRWDAVDFGMSGWPSVKTDPEFIERADETGVEMKWMFDALASGSLRAWDVQCAFHMLLHGLYAVEPRFSLTRNIGFGTDCDHCRNPNIDISTAPFYDFLPRIPDALSPEPAIFRQYRNARFARGFAVRAVRALQRAFWRFSPVSDIPLEIQNSSR